jgi:Protein of unknown function (DUF2905)
VKRSAILFLVILALATYLWPWLREIGLLGLPGNVVAEIRGHRLHVPLGLSLLISAAISGTWWMLHPRR